MSPIKRPVGLAQYRFQRKQNAKALSVLFKGVGADYNLFRKMGFSASEVAGLEYNYLPKKELLALFKSENSNKGLSYEQIEQIRKYRISAKKLLDAGYTPLELLAAKYSYSNLREAGIDVVALKKKIDALKAKVKELSVQKIQRSSNL